MVKAKEGFKLGCDGISLTGMDGYKELLSQITIQNGKRGQLTIKPLAACGLNLVKYKMMQKS